MSKRDKLNLQGGMTVETYLDGTGRIYIAYARGASVFLQDVKALRQFLKLPPKTDSRLALDSWLASLADMDAKRKGAIDAPLGDANVEGSWDPQAHDVDNDATRMIT
jgi:hypothetical protein